MLVLMAVSPLLDLSAGVLNNWTRCELTLRHVAIRPGKEIAPFRL